MELRGAPCIEHHGKSSSQGAPLLALVFGFLLLTSEREQGCGLWRTRALRSALAGVLVSGKLIREGVDDEGADKGCRSGLWSRTAEHPTTGSLKSNLHQSLLSRGSGEFTLDFFSCRVI